MTLNYLTGPVDLLLGFSPNGRGLLWGFGALALGAWGVGLALGRGALGWAAAVGASTFWGDPRGKPSLPTLGPIGLSWARTLNCI